MLAMDGVWGQDRAIGLLQALLASGRVHHAYLFHGPVGVGKFTTSLAFARVLLCHQRQTDLAGRIVACGACASCRLMEAKDPPTDDDQQPQALAWAHPDLHVVTKELARYNEDRSTRERKLMSIPVEVIRDELIKPAYHAAQMGHGKVFIVDEAELLNISSQNAMLKTLEEPPTGTTIILVTSIQDRLLPTIRSRCQRIAFVPLPDSVVSRWLQGHAADLEPSQHQWVVRFAQGSLGRARLAVDFGLFEWGEAVLPSLESFTKGRPDAQMGAKLAQRIDELAQAWVKRHPDASKEAANKMAAGLMEALIAEEARHRLSELAQQCDPADPIASEAVLEPWLGVIDAVEEAHRLIRANANVALVCDHLAATMARRLA
ncbi:MAG TPA: DNA polymerase III subunit, partial [Phycisphaeraceae bacterium]